MRGLPPSVRKIARELSRSRFRNPLLVSNLVGFEWRGNLPRTRVGVLELSLNRRPHPPLFAPIKCGGYGANVRFLHHGAAVLGARQEENLFLDVGSETQKRHNLHNLRHARLCDSAECCEFRLVRDNAVADQLVATDL